MPVKDAVARLLTTIFRGRDAKKRREDKDGSMALLIANITSAMAALARIPSGRSSQWAAVMWGGWSEIFNGAGAQRFKKGNIPIHLGKP